MILACCGGDGRISLWFTLVGFAFNFQICFLKFAMGWSSPKNIHLFGLFLISQFQLMSIFLKHLLIKKEAK